MGGWLWRAGRSHCTKCLGLGWVTMAGFLLFLHLRNKKISSDHLQKGQIRVDVERQTGPCREWLGDTRSRSTSSLSGPMVEVGAGTGGGGCLHRTKVLAKGVGMWTLKLGMPCAHHASSNTGAGGVVLAQKGALFTDPQP